MSDLSFGLAFLAGMASFLSPCVFSLVPVYVSYLSGRSAARISMGEVRNSHIVTFIHGLAFILGFTLVFVTLGTLAGALGAALAPIRYWLTRVGGIVVIIFGIHMTGLIRIPFLDYDLRRHTPLQNTTGFISSFLMGIFFSAGWTPCVGPVLGAILTLALNGGSLVTGALLLTTYSLGLGIPFLIAAVAINWISLLLKRYSRFLHYVEVFMGILLVGIGIMLFLGSFNQLAQFGIFVDFGI